ncbi:hypothetical protein [Vagococcus fluvialis]|uniref:hypothetical protein n=1 Tax=Vagococcus fluvialis TaxID=2738 RepID=UPI001D0B4716|nr:hypothetical protein [Vagococcus fluvialis]UDM84065.1 hypothetical protein K5K96_15240 [Vagococcus fluvialis]
MFILLTIAIYILMFFSLLLLLLLTLGFIGMLLLSFFELLESCADYLEFYLKKVEMRKRKKELKELKERAEDTDNIILKDLVKIREKEIFEMVNDKGGKENE